MATQLSAHRRQQVLAPTLLDLGTLVRNSYETLRKFIPENIKLLSPEIELTTAIYADQTQVLQILFALASAASDRISSGGEIAIAVRRMALARPLGKPGLRIPEGDYVVLQLQTRLSPEIQSNDAPTKCKISFQMQRRNAPPAIGQTVKQNNGFLWVDDTLPGTIAFSVYFSRMVGQASGMSNKALGGAIGGRETILLVEDDLALREAMREYLTCLGYRVLWAGDGEDALATAQSVQHIDAVITDLRMPKMGGDQLVERLIVTLPALKFMFVSGNFDREFLDRYAAEERTAMLSKPFQMRDLGWTLRKLLDKNSDARRSG